MIRAHRPDLAEGRIQTEILELRRDAKVTREITARFTERNAEMLRKRGLPVTPGTLYLAHFAGGAGAVAILLAMENADAALVMATADATGRTKREKIIKANPFLERFTVADLRNWATAKCMRLVYSCARRTAPDPNGIRVPVVWYQGDCPRRRPNFECQAVGTRSVGYGRAYFVTDAKRQALIQCERRSGVCIISYCVRAY
jgi:hypothetical protein